MTSTTVDIAGMLAGVSIGLGVLLASLVLVLPFVIFRRAAGV